MTHSAHFRRGVPILVAALMGAAGLACSSPSDADPTEPIEMDFTVLFTGPVEEPLPACEGGHASTVLEGTATHLGPFSGTGSTCILSVTPDSDPPCVPAAAAPWAAAPFTNPRWVLVAEDGDELWMASDDAVAVLAVNPDGTYRALCAQGTTRIVGGTGRFADATGELETTAVNDDGQGPDDVRSEGWIRY